MINQSALNPFFFEEFTSREKEILIQISSGHESKDISAYLNISVETVKTHRKNMLKKSLAKNMFELVAICSRKLIPTEQPQLY